MADSSEQCGVASDLARQASERVRTVVDWVEARDPADLLTELKGYARRKPGTFLAAAAALGFLGGRLTRGLTAGQADDSPQGSQYGGGSSYGSGSFADTGGSGTMAPGAYGEPVSTPPAVPMVTGTSHGESVSYADGSGAGTERAMTGVPDYPAEGGFDDELTPGDYREPGLGGARATEADQR